MGDRGTRAYIPAAERLRTLCKQKGWTQQELADEAGLSIDAVRYALNGKPVLLRSLKNMAEAFQVKDVSELIESPPKPALATPVPPSDIVVQRRKEVALRLALEWGPQTEKHRQALEARWPGALSRVREKATREEAERIYAAEAGSQEGELRLHLIGVLNYLETVATAYRHQAADENMVKEQFRDVMVRWRMLLDEVIHVFWERHTGEGMRPWEPLVLLVDIGWNQALGPDSQEPTLSAEE